MGTPFSPNLSPRISTVLPNVSGAENQATSNAFGDALYQASLPGLAHQCLMGNLVHAQTTTLRTSIAALPTTTADAQLYNGEASTGKSYIMTRMGFYIGAVDTTQADMHMLVGSLQTAANVTASGVPTDATNKKQKGNTGAYGGKAAISLGATVVNNGWFSFGTCPPTAGVVAGSVWHSFEYNCDGSIIIPPGGALGVTQLSVSTTATAVSYYFQWIELVLPPLG